MKILRLSAIVFAAAAACTVGCGSSGCGGSNTNSNVPTVSCGNGTQLVNGVCVLPAATQSK